MASMTSPIPTTQPDRVVIGGIDTHKDIHVAALLDSAGMVLAAAKWWAKENGNPSTTKKTTAPTATAYPVTLRTRIAACLISP